MYYIPNVNKRECHEKLIIPHTDPNSNAGAGLKSTISFNRLEDMLRRTGELKPDESISGFEVGTYGIQYTIIKQEKLNGKNPR